MKKGWISTLNVMDFLILALCMFNAIAVSEAQSTGINLPCNDTTLRVFDEEEDRCICLYHNGTYEGHRRFGIACNITLSKFFYSSFSSINLPQDVPDYLEQERLFNELNDKVKEFERLFQLQEGSGCDVDPEVEGKANQLIGQILKLEVENNSFTRQDYKDLINEIDKFLKDFGGKTFCRHNLYDRSDASRECPFNTPPFKCRPNPTDNRMLCVHWGRFHHHHTLTEHLKPLQSLSFGETCPPNFRQINQDRWKTKDVDDCLREVGREFEFLLDNWLAKTKFCNETAGLFCKYHKDFETQGTCKLDPNYKEPDYEDDDEENDSHHFYVNLQFIFFCMLIELLTQDF